MNLYKWIEDCFIAFLWFFSVMALTAYLLNFPMFYYLITLSALATFFMVICLWTKDKKPINKKLSFIVIICLMGLPIFFTYLSHEIIDINKILQFFLIYIIICITLTVILYSRWGTGKLPTLTQKELKQEEREINFLGNVFSLLGVAFPLWVQIIFENVAPEKITFKEILLEKLALLFSLICLSIIMFATYSYARAMWKRLGKPIKRKVRKIKIRNS